VREGRSLPSILPYLALMVFAAICYLVLAFVIDPRVRDEAVFSAVMETPVEPRNLRAYFIDSRNTAHRDEVTKKLSEFYDKPIDHVRMKGKDPELREGLAQILESVRTAPNPIVTVFVKEANTPAGQEGGKARREEDIRTQFVKGLNTEFSKQPWGQPATANIAFDPDEPKPIPPPPIGEQFLAYVVKPDDVDHAHFEITYSMDQIGGLGQSRLTMTVEIRTNVTEGPVRKATIVVPGVFDPGSIDAQVPKIASELVKQMAGESATQPGLPGLPQPFPPFGP
jgi:hypothetical protein